MSDSDSDESVTHLNIAIDFREDPADYPPIFIAARDGDVQVMRAELAAGVDPNLRGADSHTTPLGVIVSNTTIANQNTHFWNKITPCWNNNIFWNKLNTTIPNQITP